MDAAQQLVPTETEALAWAEICVRYPDQYVCLVDIERIQPRHPAIKTARVVGHGPTQDAAFAPIRSLDARYPLFSVRYTGICTAPLIRPALVVDDETIELIRL